MKVFFNSSIRGLKEYKENYKKISQVLVELGCSHTYLANLSESPQDNVYHLPEEGIKEVHASVNKAISDSDVVILEVSTHSLSQGYILHKAISDRKPVIALYVNGSFPAFAAGINTDKFQLIEYTKDNVKSVLALALDYAKDKTDIRFNLFLNSEQNAYLEDAARKQNIPRSVFIRNLIQKHQEENS